MPIIFEYYDQFCFCWCCEWWWFLLQHSPNWSPSIMKLSLVYSKSRDFGATRGRDNTGKDIQSIESRRSTSFLGKKPTIQVYENLKCWMWIQSGCVHIITGQKHRNCILYIQRTATYQMQSDLRMRPRKLFVIVSAQPLLSNHFRTRYYHLIL